MCHLDITTYDISISPIINPATLVLTFRHCFVTVSAYCCSEEEGEAMEDKEEVTTYRTVDGKGNNPVFIASGHIYHREKTRQGKVYVRCHRWRAGCVGRATLDCNSNRFLAEVQHNGDHSGDEKEVLLRQSRARLRQYSEECISGHMKETYDRAAAEMPEAAIHLSFVQVQRCMNGWRRKKWPKNPTSAPDALRLFQEGASSGASFARHFITGGHSEHGTFIIFLNVDEPVFTSLEQTPSFHADGTFRTAPRHFYQLVFLFLESNDVVFPVGCIWMDNKSGQLYQKAFTSLSHHLPEGCRPANIMCDFEINLRNALTSLFPGVVPDGCFFHFVQVTFVDV